MREILFRGKRRDTGEWVVGYLLNHVDGSVPIIISRPKMDDSFELEFEYDHVDPKTVCQFTGLTDKNGVKIWENDILWVTDDEGNAGLVDTGLGEIDFLEGLWYISGSVQNSLYDIDKCFQIEVIGNIFDNPELIEGGGLDE